MRKTFLWMGLLITGTAVAQQPVVIPPPPPTTTTTTTTTTTPQTDTIVVKPEAAQPVKQDTVYVAQQPEKKNDYDELRKGYFGVRALATVTDIDFNELNDGAIETEIIWGWGFGGFLGYHFNPHLALQGEVLYQSLAQRVKYSNLDARLNLKYLNIPLLLVLNTDVRKPVNLNVCVGPQLGIRLAADVEQEEGSGTNPDTVQAVVAVKPADIGFAYGAGLDFRLAEGFSLGIGYRGVIGVIDIDENSQNTTTNNFYILDRSKMRTYSAYAGLKFAF